MNIVICQDNTIGVVFSFNYMGVAFFFCVVVTKGLNSINSIGRKDSTVKSPFIIIIDYFQ